MSAPSDKTVAEFIRSRPTDDVQYLIGAVRECIRYKRNLNAAEIYAAARELRYGTNANNAVRPMQSLVTILIYTFPPKGNEAAAFARIVASIERTWKLVGELDTVVVSSHRFDELTSFSEKHPNVIVQIEPSLVPGQIRTMSLDCIKNLYKRFTTPYVLIIQDDGFPIKSNLGDFVGRADYWGAPIISDGWKRKLAYAIGFGSFNGGFSLRSRALCEYASKMWHRLFSKFVPEAKLPIGEDVYYTFWLKFLPSTWLRFKFPNERDAFKFAVDRLSGHVTPPENADPFGVHGREWAVKLVEQIDKQRESL